MRLILLSFVIMFVVPACAGATIYHVDNQVSCSDSNPGTEMQPWCTISQAASTLSPGDTVYVHAGTYEEQVSVSASGTPGNYINYVGYWADSSMPVMRGFVINGASYIRIIGFEITHDDNSVNGAVRGTGTTSYVEILHNYIHHVRGRAYGQGPVICDEGTATYWTLLGNTIYYVGYIPGVYDGSNNAAIGGNWPSPGTSHWLVEYNDISRSMDYFTLTGTHHIIRNNYIHDTSPDYWVNVGGGESGFHIDAFQAGSDGGQSYHRYNVYEANFISDFVNYYHCHGALEQDSDSYGDTDIIMRGNVFANMAGGGSGGFSVDYVTMYHNTFHEMNQNGNNGATIIMYTRGGDDPEYIVAINNILSEDGSDDPMKLNDYPVSGTVSEYNLGYNSGSDPSYINTSNPLFTNPSTQDLTLSSVSSPAYNAGREITNIISPTGSGTSFDVTANTANRLIDGHDIVNGDNIIVGANETRITDIAGSTITVEDTISWSSGDPVYWGSDSAPDIGAFPYKASGYSITNTLNYNDNDQVSQGSVPITTTVNDPTLVRFVEFWIDGLPHHIDYDAPYEYTWDASGESEGTTHMIEAVARPLYADKTISYSDSALVSIGTPQPCPYCCSSGNICSSPISGTGCSMGETCCASSSECTSAPYCGDGTCDADEDCTTCPEDCPTPVSQVCCSGALYTGDCCDDANCISPDTCQSHTCQPPTLTCTGQGYLCCTECEPGTSQPSFDSDCSDQVCCSECLVADCMNSTSSWQNTGFFSQTGTFTVEYDAIPNQAAIDAVTAISQTPGSVYSDYAILVRFNTNNLIDARNAGTYTYDSSIYYIQGTQYHFRLDIDVLSHTYSVYVTPEDQSEQILAEDYAFRTEQSGATELSNWGLTADLGTHEVCNFGLAGDYHAVDTNQNCNIEQPEIFAYMDLWHHDSTNYPMHEMMEAIGYYYSGSYC